MSFYDNGQFSIAEMADIDAADPGITVTAILGSAASISAISAIENCPLS